MSFWIMYSFHTLSVAVTPMRIRNKPIGRLMLSIWLFTVSKMSVMPLRVISMLMMMLMVAVVRLIVVSFLRLLCVRV